MKGAVILFAVMFAAVGSAYMIATTKEMHRPIIYNCDMLIGGWHPDVPVEVQKQCREKTHEQKL